MKIALIHATPLSIEPIVDAFKRHWPKPQLVNILDDSLSRDRLVEKTLSEDMFRRINALADYADSLSVEAILYTCSAFSPAIEQVALHKPFVVMNPNQSMLVQAVTHYQHIGVLSSFAATAANIEKEINDLAVLAEKECEVFSCFEPSAMAVLSKGDGQYHDELLCQSAQQLVANNPQIQVLLLSQYSTASAAPLIRQETKLPVLTSPESAVLALHKLLT